MRAFYLILLLNLILFSSSASTYGVTCEGIIIEGLKLEKIEGTKIVYLIEASKATFGNKRIGFFNLAFIKVINLENVDFKLYSNGCVVETKHLDKAVYEINTKSLFDEKGNLVFRETSK